jgi:hypothetical protein
MLLSLSSGYSKDIQIKVFSDNDIPLDSLCSLRIVCLNDDEVKLVEYTLDALIKPDENIFQSRVAKLGKLRNLFDNILTIRNEIEVLQNLIQLLKNWEISHATSLEDDEKTLIDLSNSSDDDETKWKKLSAVTYRLTRKRYVTRLLQIVQYVEKALTSSG